MTDKTRALSDKLAEISSKTRHLLTGKPGESWQAALHRFQQLMDQDVDAYIDEDTNELVIINLLDERGTPAYVCEVAEDKERLQHYSTAYDFPLPIELVELMCTHGCFKLPGGHRDYALLFTTWKNSGDENRPIGWSFKTIDDTIKWNFGSFPQDLFTVEELEHFRYDLLFWGIYSAEHDGDYTYMFVDRAGRYGLFRYNEEDWPETRRHFIEPIAQGVDQRYSLNQLISQLVDRVIRATFERYEIPIADE